MFISSSCILKGCTLWYDIVHNAYAKRKTYSTDSNCFKRFICLFLNISWFTAHLSLFHVLFQKTSQNQSAISRTSKRIFSRIRWSQQVALNIKMPKFIIEGPKFNVSFNHISNFYFLINLIHTETTYECAILTLL